MLAAVQLRRPTLTLAKIWTKQSILYKRVKLPTPKGVVCPLRLGQIDHVFSSAHLCHDGRRGREV